MDVIRENTVRTLVKVSAVVGVKHPQSVKVSAVVGVKHPQSVKVSVVPAAVACSSNCLHIDTGRS